MRHDHQPAPVRGHLGLGSDGVWPAGVDEAGRGPLAGPVVAAAVVLHPARAITALDDSKRLSAPRREALAAQIRMHAAAWAIAWADAAEIDRLNILNATLLAMSRAVRRLPLRPHHVLVDGTHCPAPAALGCAGRALVGGDALEPAISAASILAKVYRDAWMVVLDEHYPGYGLAVHKGYPTPAHREALRRLGPSPVHRHSFAPVRAAARPWAAGA